MTHRLGFRLMARDDAMLVWLNLLLLMFVAFLPFPTAVGGAHAGSPAAAVLYATSVCLASTASVAYLSGDLDTRTKWLFGVTHNLTIPGSIRGDRCYADQGVIWAGRGQRARSAAAR